LNSNGVGDVISHRYDDQILRARFPIGNRHGDVLEVAPDLLRANHLAAEGMKHADFVTRGDRPEDGLGIPVDQAVETRVESVGGLAHVIRHGHCRFLSPFAFTPVDLDRVSLSYLTTVVQTQTRAFHESSVDRGPRPTGHPAPG